MGGGVRAEQCHYEDGQRTRQGARCKYQFFVKIADYFPFLCDICFIIQWVICLHPAGCATDHLRSDIALRSLYRVRY